MMTDGHTDGTDSITSTADAGGNKDDWPVAVLGNLHNHGTDVPYHMKKSY